MSSSSRWLMSARRRRAGRRGRSQLAARPRSGDPRYVVSADCVAGSSQDAARLLGNDAGPRRCEMNTTFEPSHRIRMLQDIRVIPCDAPGDDLLPAQKSAADRRPDDGDVPRARDHRPRARRRGASGRRPLGGRHRRRPRPGGEGRRSRRAHRSADRRHTGAGWSGLPTRSRAPSSSWSSTRSRT